jgi:RNA 3'-terminal phosphate cyclase (ATP)
VLQTILVPLLVAAEPSMVVLEGGTHNPAAPSFDFLTKSFLPLVARMGARVDATLERPGFAPAGGGISSSRSSPRGRSARWSCSRAARCSRSARVRSWRTCRTTSRGARSP